MLTPDALCHPSFLKELLARHQVTLSHSLGQNFLINPEIPKRIAASANLDPDQGVLEIGPGAGALTVCLLPLCGGLTAIELDSRMIPVLQESVGDSSSFHVIQGDVLKANLPKICQETLPFSNITALANLPYYITTPAITALLEAHCFRSIIIMVQKEVASRILSSPGNKEYGAFTLFVNYRASAELLFDVPASNFFPVPKVQSAVIKLTPYKNPPVSCKDPSLLEKVIRASFSQRRKKLINGLQSGFPQFSKPQLTEAMALADIPDDIRGEKLSLEDFARLSDAIFSI